MGNYFCSKYIIVPTYQFYIKWLGPNNKEKQPISAQNTFNIQSPSLIFKNLKNGA